MAEAVYIACAALSAACAVMLVRAYRRSRVRFLLWSGLCFAGLTVNNTFLFVDLVVAPGIDLSLYRGLAAVAGYGLLIYGLIWDAT